MLSKLSVKKPYTVIVGIILVIVLGYISFQHMSTDLLPSMNLPYVVVYTPYPGATPEQVEGEVTRPMEASFATLTDIKKLRSQSRDNVSVVIMQFNDGANMDTALIEISSALDQLKGTWDDDVGAPVALKLNPDMLPVAILSVSHDDMDILALSDYVNDELVPAFEGLNGVAAANASGVIEQEVDVTIEQSRIDVVNSAILKEVDKELAKVERKLNEAQAKISDGKRQLANGRAMAKEKLKQAEDALKKGESQITPAIEQLTAQRDALKAQRDQLAQAVAAMEAASNMTDEQKAAVRQGAEQLKLLRQQKAALEAQLAAIQSGENANDDNAALLAQRQAAQAQRDQLNAAREAQKAYLEDLKLMDADALSAEITRLNAEIADAETRLDAEKAELKELNEQRSQLKKEVDDLSARIAGAEDKQPTPATDSETARPTSTAAPEDNGSDDAEPGETVAPGDSSTDAPEATATDAPTTAPEDGSTYNPEQGETTAPTATAEAGDGSTDAPEATVTDAPTTPPEDSGTDSPEQGETTEPTPGTETTDGGSDNPDPTPQGDASQPTQAADATEKPAATDGETQTPGSDQSETQPGTTQPQGQDEGTQTSTGQGSEQSTESPTESQPKTETESNTEESQPKTETESNTGEIQPKTETESNTEESQPAAEEKSAPKAEAQPAVTAEPQSEQAESARLSLGRALAENEDVSALRERLSAAQARLEEVEAKISSKSAGIAQQEAEIAVKRTELQARQQALDTLKDSSEDIQARVSEAEARIAELDQSIAALDEQIAAMDSALASGAGDAGVIAGQLAVIEQQIQALEAAGVEQAAEMIDDPKQLKAQYKEAKDGLDEMDKGIAALDETIGKLEQGIIPGGYIEGIDKDTKLSEAEEQLKKARSEMESAFGKAESMLSKAEKELAKARKEFNEKREDAFKEAGLDGVITVQMVAQIIGAQNFSMPAGYVRDLEEDQVLVRVGDKFGSVDELKRMKLFNLDMDSIEEVRLLDVASVQLTDNRDDVFTKLDGQDGILLSLEKQSTYSTADVADTVLEKARELQAANPELHIVDLMNQGEYIDLVVSSVLQNLIYGGGLAILILLLFLLDWRPTLTVAFSIPISVVVAFVAMYFSGITLNVLSLSGLALGIGMLVDNSIVSIENVYRLHDEERLPPLRACVEGVKSVSGALFSSTLTTICVFLPIVFVQGMARDLFADMGLTIAFSLLASLLVAMTVVPMMSSFLMRRAKVKKHRIFSKFQAAYSALLKGALRVKPLVLLAAVALLVFSGMQVTKMGISFMPEVNSRQMSADYTPDDELSDADQKAMASRIMTDMLEIPGIQSIGLMSGASSTLLGSGGGYSYYIIVDEEAGVKNIDIVRQIDAIAEKYDVDIAAQASTMDISMMTGSGISVDITGDDIDTLQAIARDVAEIARSTEGTTDVSDGLENAVPELRLVVDKEKAIDQSLTTAQVYQFIAQKLMEKTEVGKVTLDGKEMKIQLIEGRNRNIRPEDIQDLEIEVEKEEEDVMVRIGDITEIRDAESLSTIQRLSQRRMVEVSFAIAEGYSANLVSDAFEAKLNEYRLPDGYKAELSGENETVMDIMEDLVWMILVAILLIFLIMVAQFQSFKSPIIVMFTIPLAFTGGLLALLLTGMDLSIVAMLGFLVLSGVVVNNGIVFIDCVNQLRIAGWEKKEALVEAGRQRLRPILMTALTTILGMSTMALGQGTGAEMMQPMAVVSIGGLTYATLMTLFVVPVLYDLVNGRKMKAREIQMIREAAGMNGDEVLEGDAPAAPTEPPVRAEAEASSEPAEPATPAEPTTPVEPDPVREAPPVPVFKPRPEPAAASPVAKPIRIQLRPAKKK